MRKLKKFISLFSSLCISMLLISSTCFAYSDDPTITLSAGELTLDQDNNYSCILTIKVHNHGFDQEVNGAGFNCNFDFGELADVTVDKLHCTGRNIGKSIIFGTTDQSDFISSLDGDGKNPYTSDDIVIELPINFPETTADGDYIVTLTQSKYKGYAYVGKGNSITSIWEGYSAPTTTIHVGPTITADTSAVGTVAPGSTFDVPVKITNNPGLVGYTLYPDFDADAFEYVSYTKDSAWNGTFVENQTNGSVNYSSNDTETDETVNGTLLTYKFKVKDGAADGDYSIGFKATSEASNAALKELALSFTPGSVTVEAPEPAAYSAYLSTEATEVKAGETFDADLYLKGSNITACSTVLNCENGTIEAISPAADLSYAEGSNSKFSFYGGNSLDFTKGVKVATVKVVADSYLAAGAKVTLSIDNKTFFTVAGKDISLTLGNDKSVSVEVPSAKDYESTSLVNSGKSLVLYGKSVDEGNIVKYKNQEMLYSDKYKVWVCLVDNAPESLVSTDFTTEQGTVQKVNYTGDLNGENGLTATDMQLAYNIATGVSVENLTDTMLLSADANGNKSITTNDARYIQCLFHGLDPEKNA